MLNGASYANTVKAILSAHCRQHLVKDCPENALAVHNSHHLTAPRTQLQIRKQL